MTFYTNYTDERNFLIFIFAAFCYPADCLYLLYCSQKNKNAALSLLHYTVSVTAYTWSITDCDVPKHWMSSVCLFISAGHRVKGVNTVKFDKDKD